MSLNSMVWLTFAVAVACRGPVQAPARAAGDLRADLPAAELARAQEGKALFHKAYTPQEGLGPHFNFESCGSCHDKPASGGHGDAAHSARLTRVDGDVDGLPLRHLPGHAPLVPRPGAPTSLHKPPPLYGLGLVEALDDAAIADHCGQAPELGIAGIANVNPGRQRVGRFGFKAHTVTLQDFIANALTLEMGLTNPLERDPRHFTDGDAVADPEVPTRTVERIADYVRALAPPPPGAAHPAAEAQFADLGCAHCHRPATAPGVQAYSDFCVHDLGAAFDNRIPDFRAGPSHWRTAPLWGLRWRDRYFHDDRAGDLDAAIRMHGGEAAKVVERYAALAEGDRKTLLVWLNSL
ncbi:MAG: hypothetical protein FJ100_13005 [Deltaproteobacteria bacterium]|nr:hypothetical protein [Deltaproteobacteria bacterium]